MPHLRVTFLNLPDPPGMRVHRLYAGGFGTVEHIEPGAVTSSTLMPPIFEATAAAVLEGMGHRACIVDAQSRELDMRSTVESIARTRPDVIVSKVSMPAFQEDSEVISAVSAGVPDAKIAVWGPVARVFPERIRGIGGISAAVLGELEFCLPFLIAALYDDEQRPVAGSAVFTKKGILSTPPPAPGSLDDLPLPAHHLLDMSRIRTAGNKFCPGGGVDEKPFYVVLTSRGCNYGCIYCPYSVIFDRGWRAMSPGRIVAELEELVENHGVHNIWFLDEVLTQDYARMEKICSMVIERDLDLNWRCESRVDRLPRDLLELMKRAGCGCIQVGVETGDPRLMSVGKPGSSVPLVERVFGDLKEVGIMARASAMVGLPGETWESVRMTEELLNRIDPVSVEVGISTPYPGTPFHDMAVERGWLVDEDFSHYTISRPVTSFQGFTSADIARARRYLLDRFLFRKRVRESVASARDFNLSSFPREFLPGNLRASFWRLENFVRVRARFH